MQKLSFALVKEVDLKVNTGKTKYVFVSCHRNAEQSHNKKIADRCFENVLELQLFGNDNNEWNLNSKEFNGSLNSSDVGNHSVQNVLPAV
jgi:D-Tyr-tRNAtyr deacylase